MLKIMIVRAGALLIGSAAIVFSVLWAEAPFRSINGYHHASQCRGGIPTSAADTHGCLAWEYGVVTGRSTHDVSSDDSGSSNTEYEVDYRRASGATEQQTNVDEDLYNAVATGHQVELETWQGGVVAVFAGQVGSNVTPPGTDRLTLCLWQAWIGVGLLVWFLAGDGTLLNLFGVYGMRSIFWTMSGALLIYIGTDIFANGADTGKYIIGGIVAVMIIPMMVISVTLMADDDTDGDDSLLDRAYSWRYRRKARKRREQRAKN